MGFWKQFGKGLLNVGKVVAEATPTPYDNVAIGIGVGLAERIKERRDAKSPPQENEVQTTSIDPAILNPRAIALKNASMLQLRESKVSYPNRLLAWAEGNKGKIEHNNRIFALQYAYDYRRSIGMVEENEPRPELLEIPAPPKPLQLDIEAYVSMALGSGVEGRNLDHLWRAVDIPVYF